MLTTCRLITVSSTRYCKAHLSFTPSECAELQAACTQASCWVQISECVQTCAGISCVTDSREPGRMIVKAPSAPTGKLPRSALPAEESVCQQISRRQPAIITLTHCQVCVCVCAENTMIKAKVKIIVWTLSGEWTQKPKRMGKCNQ